MKDLIKIDHKEYGLEETKAAEINKMFSPMLKKMEKLEKEFNLINKQPIDINATKKAKELRLKYVKIRTGTAAIHKELKSFYLQGGRFVDGWKNAQLFASQGIEEKLMDIEKHFENIEKERKEKEALEIQALHDERANELENYGEYVSDGLGSMSLVMWENLLSGTKNSYETEQKRIAEEKRIEEEKQAELERVNKLHKTRRDSILHLWNYLAKDAQHSFFGDVDQAGWDSFVLLLEDEKIEDDKKAQAEKEAAEKLAKENEKLKSEKLAAEKKEQERIMKEFEDKEAARILEENEAKRKELESKKLASAPDKEKIKDLMHRLDSEIYLPEMTTKEGFREIELISIQLRKLKNVIENCIDKL